MSAHLHRTDAEIFDIRNHPQYKEHADHWAYGAKLTDGLPLGTQASFIKAAMAAAKEGLPLNTLLSIRWTSLFSDNDVNPLRSMPIPQRIDYMVELFRKWWAKRGLPVFYIWVREIADSTGEHWHIAFHLPKKLRHRFAGYVADLTQEPIRRTKRPFDLRTEGEFACSEIGSWHLAEDVKPDRGGYFLAAYLGKGEPSEYIKRGKCVANTKKPVRGKSFGGKQPDGKYDAAQGAILGTIQRKDRFFVSNALKTLAKDGTVKKHNRIRKTADAMQTHSWQLEMMLSAE